MLPGDDLLLATWDRRLHAGAKAEGLGLIPENARLNDKPGPGKLRAGRSDSIRTSSAEVVFFVK
jgi:hypothetical protein